MSSQNYLDGKHDEYLGEHALILCDNIRNYKFVWIITAYYSNRSRAVYGSLFIPTSLFTAQPEYKYYTVNVEGFGTLKFDAIQYETDTQCRIINSSAFPIGIYGVN